MMSPILWVLISVTTIMTTTAGSGYGLFAWAMKPKFSDDDRRRLATIIPLMKKSLAIYSRMEIGGVSQEIYQQLLSSMGIACFILGANYEVMAKNYLAEMVLSNKDGLSIVGKKLVLY